MIETANSMSYFDTVPLYCACVILFRYSRPLFGYSVFWVLQAPLCFQHSQLLIYVPLNFVFSDRNCVYYHARNHFILHYTGELLSEAENGIQQHNKYRAQTDHVPPVARGAVSTAFTGVTAGPVGPVVQLSRTTEQR